MDTLQIIWYALTGVLLAAFFVTGGCDFGAGINSIFVGSKERRIFTDSSILPFWDGNQVWLITAGGALFAAFPPAYSRILSIMYTPVILLLLCITVRVAAIEFFASAKTQNDKNRWAWIFSISSLLSVLLMGVALGAIFTGKVATHKGDFATNFLNIFTPLTICAGILTILFFCAQASLFTAIRADGRNDEIFFLRFAKKTTFFLLLGYVGYVVIFAVSRPQIPLGQTGAMMLFLISYLPLRLSIRAIKKVKMKTALGYTSLFAILLVASHLLMSFPYIVPAENAKDGLSIYAGSSSETTLKIMLIVALIGVPLAIIYNVFSYTANLRKTDKQQDDNVY